MPDMKELHDVNTALKELDRLEYLVNVLVKGSRLKEVYRKLKSFGTTNTANNMLVHTTNISDEIKRLRSTLEDARAILIQRMKQDE